MDTAASRVGKRKVRTSLDKKKGTSKLITAKKVQFVLRSSTDKSFGDPTAVGI